MSARDKNYAIPLPGFLEESTKYLTVKNNF